MCALKPPLSPLPPPPPLSVSPDIAEACEEVQGLRKDGRLLAVNITCNSGNVTQLFWRSLLINWLMSGGAYGGSGLPATP